MGYSTSFNLKITPFAKTTKKKVTLEDVIAQVSKSSDIDQEQLLKNLKAVQSNSEIAVTADDVMQALRQENENARYALGEDGDAEESCKWYEHETEMKAFSKKYPEWLFALSGTGEESGDIWKKYFVNGKFQSAKAVITLEDFDPKKLK